MLTLIGINVLERSAIPLALAAPHLRRAEAEDALERRAEAALVGKANSSGDIGDG